MTKVTDIQIIGNRAYFRLNGCSNDELIKITDYKSWEMRTWKRGKERKYFSWVHPSAEKFPIIWCYVGFAPVLIRYLQTLGYIINGKELFRSSTISIGNTRYEPWDFQCNAINAWISSGCAGVIKMPTGSGKTFSACRIIQQMKLKTLVLVHTNDLLINAWLNTFVEQFGEGIKSQIGVIGGNLSKKDRKNMRIVSSTSYESNIDKDIVIATSQSLLNKLNKLCNERFGLVIVDEVHHYPSEQFSKVVNNVRAPYRLGLSATLLRSDGATPLIWGLLGDICYRISIRELVTKGVLVSPLFTTIIINDEKVQNNIATCGLSKLDLSRYVKKMSASSAKKVMYILSLVDNLRKNGKKFVLYTDFVNSESTEVFARDFYVAELNKRGIRAVGVSADMTGSERSRVFTMLENGKIDGLVFGLLGSEGVNIPRIDSVVMCNATKSTIRYTQRVGRSMRVVKDDRFKKNAFVYEVILNTPLELKWSNVNFWEYQTENYVKEKLYVS